MNARSTANALVCFNKIALMTKITMNVWETQPCQLIFRTAGVFTRSFRLVSRFIDLSQIFELDLFYLIISNYYKSDPCDQITCNGKNAQCQVYLGGPKEGEPFCACPQGFSGDPNTSCGKHLYFVIKNWPQFLKFAKY